MAATSQHCMMHPRGFSGGRHGSWNNQFHHGISEEYDCGVTRVTEHSIFCAWKRPRSNDLVVVNCDGSFRPHNGSVGYGFIARKHDGKVIVAKAKAYKKDIGSGNLQGEVIVLEAEMLAIRDAIQGLALHRDKFPRVIVRSDSKNAVAIVNNKARCPKECEEILNEINAARGCFKEPGHLCCCVFVYREANRAADFLSKYMKQDGVLYLDPSNLPHLNQIVKEDANSHEVERLRKY